MFGHPILLGWIGLHSSSRSLSKASPSTGRRQERLISPPSRALPFEPQGITTLSTDNITKSAGRDWCTRGRRRTDLLWPPLVHLDGALPLDGAAARDGLHPQGGGGAGPNGPGRRRGEDNDTHIIGEKDKRLRIGEKALSHVYMSRKVRACRGRLLPTSVAPPRRLRKDCAHTGAKRSL